MRKLVFSLFLILLFFLLFSYNQNNYFNEHTTKTIFLKDKNPHVINIKPNSLGFFRLNVFQCNLDIEVHFISSSGDPVFVDRPTGRNSNESFLFQYDGDPFQATIYSIDNQKSIGYIEVSLEKMEESNLKKLIEAERFYLSGYRDQNIPNIKSIEKSVLKFENAISIYKQIGDVSLEASATFQLGKSYHKKESFAKAIETHLRALTLFETISNQYQVARVHNEIAVAYHELRMLDLALTHYHKSVFLDKENQDYSDLSNTYGNISFLYQQTYKPLLEKYYLDLSLDKNLVPKNSTKELFGFHKVGLYYFTQGDLEKSLKFQKDALELANRIGYTSSSFYVYILLAVADSHKKLLQIRSSRKFALSALEVTNNLAQNYIKGQVYCTLGEIEFLDSNLSVAENYFKQALNYDLRDNFDKVFLWLGIIYFKKYQNQKNIDFLKLSKKHFTSSLNQTPDPWNRAQSLYWLSRTVNLLEEKKTLRFVEEAISIIESSRGQVLDSQIQSSFFGSQILIFRHYLDILFEGFSENIIFDASEKIRARTLLDKSNDENSAKDNLPNLSEALKYHRLLYEMEEQFHDDEAIAAMEKALVPLAIKMERLDPTAHVVEPEAIQDADTIVEAMDDPSTLLISYAFGLDDTYLLALDQSGLKVHNLGKASVLHQLVEKVHPYLEMHPLRRQGLGKQDYEKALAELGQVLLGPLGDLEQKKRLIFIPDRSLQLLPFGMLPIQAGEQVGRPLIDRFQTAVLPSASVWKALKDRAAKRPQAPKSAAIFANPIFNQADPRLRGINGSRDDRPFLAALPQTQKEAQAIAQFAGQDALVATGFEANRQLAKSEQLQDYRYLHFATHAEIDAENPGQSSLVLSRFNAQGQPIDGTILLNDISQMKLNADLVTLSACETAQGKMIRGEGLMSLARGFMAAGVPRVVATLWKVPDDATSHFMIAFYKAHLKQGLSSAESLRQAQLAVRSQKRWEDPHFWAGFILIGDWE